MRIRKRHRRTDWALEDWSIVVVDGDGCEWVSIIPDSKIVPGQPILNWHGDLTQQMKLDIVNAIRASADAWEREIMRAVRGPAKIVPLKPK